MINNVVINIKFRYNIIS